jgi:sugar lactone lactonase YvrE
MVRLLALLLCVLAAPALACTGDCDGDGRVTVSELIQGVNIVLGEAEVGACAALDRDADASITVAELIEAVGALQSGCPATPTPTATATVTPSTSPSLDCETAGNICTVAGTGKAQFDGDGRAALETSFYYPVDIKFDADGRLLIMDWNNLRLRRVEADGRVTTIAGTDIEDFPTDGALASQVALHHASDMEFDGGGNLYIAGDHVPLVFRIDSEQRVRWVAGTTDYGYDGDGGPALAARLSTPFGVLPDTLGGVYISDVDAHVVRYVDAAGIITTVAGTGNKGYSGDGGPGTEAELGGPARLQFGSDGALYFCETRNHLIRRLRGDGVIETVAGTGGRGYGGDGGAARAAQFDTPYDLLFAPNGDLYVADTGNNVIRRIDSGGTVTTVIGDGQAAFRGDGGPAATSSLKRPSGLLLDSAGSLWIADTANQRVRRVVRWLAAAP